MVCSVEKLIINITLDSLCNIVIILCINDVRYNNFNLI